MEASHGGRTRTAAAIPHLSLVSSAEPAPGGFGFHSRDLMALTQWLQQADSHGYRRILIEGGSGEPAPEEGSYVLIYAPMREWASWGIARSGGHLVVWHCGTGADFGRYATMRDALESLPPVGHQAGRPAAAPAQTGWSAEAARPLMKPSPTAPRLTLVHSA